MEQSILKETLKGWELLIGDDVIVDGIVSEEEAILMACDLDMDITETVYLPKLTGPVKPKVSELKPNDLFRVDGNWYRLQKHENRKGVCTQIGLKEPVNLPGNTRITELSVLSKK